MLTPYYFQFKVVCVISTRWVRVTNHKNALLCLFTKTTLERLHTNLLTDYKKVRPVFDWTQTVDVQVAFALYRGVSLVSRKNWYGHDRVWYVLAIEYVFRSFRTKIAKQRHVYFMRMIYFFLDSKDQVMHGSGHLTMVCKVHSLCFQISRVVFWFIFCLAICWRYGCVDLHIWPGQSQYKIKTIPPKGALVVVPSVSEVWRGFSIKGFVVGVLRVPWGVEIICAVRLVTHGVPWEYPP